MIIRRSATALRLSEFTWASFTAALISITFCAGAEVSATQKATEASGLKERRGPRRRGLAQHREVQCRAVGRLAPARPAPGAAGAPRRARALEVFSFCCSVSG